MIKFRKKEKKVLELVEHFIDTVTECVENAEGMVLSYLDNNNSPDEELNRTVDALESQADGVRNRIRDKLYSGAYMPAMREDVFRVIKELDEVANAAETCCDMLVTQRPSIPEAHREAFREITRTSFGIRKQLAKAAQAFFDKKGTLDKVRECAHKVAAIEGEVDALEYQLTRAIFADESIELAARVHLKKCLNYIVDITDRAEDAADQVELAALKSVL